MNAGRHRIGVLKLIIVAVAAIVGCGIGYSVAYGTGNLGGSSFLGAIGGVVVGYMIVELAAEKDSNSTGDE